MQDNFSHDVVVIGGCGHVGLPLAIALADSGASVLVYDVSEAAVDLVNDGVLPFDEPGAGDKLKKAVESGALRASTDASVVGDAEHVVVVIGTPVDEHLNPDPQAVPRALERLRRRTSATASCSCCAAPSTRASPRWSSSWSPSAALDDRRGVLPRAHRRGQGDDRAVRRCRRSSRPAPSGAASGPTTLFGRAHRADRRSSSPRRPSSPSCSPTPGATSSSRRPTSST